MEEDRLLCCRVGAGKGPSGSGDGGARIAREWAEGAPGTELEGSGLRHGTGAKRGGPGRGGGGMETGGRLGSPEPYWLGSC